MEIIRDPYLVFYADLAKHDGASFMSDDAYGHLCTATTAPWTLMGREFDGASGVLTVPDATSIQNIFDGGGTAELWINADSDGEVNAGRILSKRSPANGWFFWGEQEDAGKIKLVFHVEFSTTDGLWITTSTEVTINTWAHIVITYNSSSVDNNPIIYVNDSSVTLTESTTPDGTRGTDVGEDLYIGNYSDDSATFDGTIPEVRLYTRILTPLEIQHNYEATRWGYQ